MTYKLSPIQDHIWNLKYRYKTDNSIEDTWQRIATACAVVEPSTNSAWSKKFYSILSGFKFIPAGRIIAGAGTDRSVTLQNCYVSGTIPDSLEGIFQSVKENAMTLQQGGGIGMDYSTIRFKGAKVHGVDSDASGPLSFMDVWDTMCRTIMSAGTRRGAMMGTMRCDHPDIFEFVEAKRDRNRFRNFNLSVLVTDKFMNAVQSDSDWQLIWNGKVINLVPAQDLWNAITRATYDVADPGVIFIDRMNAENNLWYCEQFSATNPCGEQPLPPYGACLLGSINLAAHVENPFTPQARLSGIPLTVQLAVRMMDNVVDISNYPLPQQQAQQKSKRRVGLGITGLADALVMLGYAYNSEKGRTVAEIVMKGITETAYETSIQLAKEKGAFPVFDAGKYCTSPFIQRLPSWILQDIAKHGIRNSHLISIAPTGTISLLADNISSGIEPIFALESNRKILQADGSFETVIVEDYALKVWSKEHRDEHSCFITADQLTPSEHLQMQAVLQPHVDTSISKTINCPESISFEAFQSVYLEAYKLGLKGCTTFRPNSTTGSVLTKVVETIEEQGKEIKHIQSNWTSVNEPVPSLAPRKHVLPGMTYKLKPFDDQAAFYITISDLDRRPFEIFINSKNMEHYQWVVALTRMISAVFRKGGDIDFVVEELKAVFDPKGGYWDHGKYVPSLVAGIGAVIEEHMGIKLTPDGEPHGIRIQDVHITSLRQCPKCNEMTLSRQENCDVCSSCDYTKCG